MRLVDVRTRLLGIGLLASVLAGACSNSSSTPKPSSSLDVSTSKANPEPRLSPDELSIRRTDPNCPDGVGVGINTAAWRSEAVDSGESFPDLAAVMLANGHTLVVASASPTPGTAVAADFESPCALNASFGNNGVVRLAIGHRGVSISAITEAPDGGALLAGSIHAGHWLVGKLTASGQMDPAFGHRGWTQLPWKYTATSIAVAHDGQIIVGGYGEGNGVSFVSKLTAHGNLVHDFGRDGRASMPPWHDGGIRGLWVEPNGNLLTLVGGGNMGCWGLVAVTITPTGQRVPGFAAQFRRALRQTYPPSPSKYPFTFFVGDVVVEQHGFRLVGTSQNGCLDNGPPRHNPTRRISDIAFDYDGTLASRGASTFLGPVAEGAWALRQAHGGLLLVTKPYTYPTFGGAKRVKLLVYRLNGQAELLSRYGNDGVATLRLPYLFDSDVEYQTAPIPLSNGHKAVLVTTNAAGDAVYIDRVPTR